MARGRADGGEPGLVRKIQDGTVTLEDLAFGGATQLGGLSFPAAFPADGAWMPVAGSSPPTPGVYAVSIAGVFPARATWFQADQACALAGKRLPTSYEWQVATAGTPDPGDTDDDATTCATHRQVVTGSRSACLSAWGRTT